MSHTQKAQYSFTAIFIYSFYSYLFWVILCHFGSFWPILGHFGSFWIFLVHSSSFWHILGHFGSFNSAF